MTYTGAMVLPQNAVRMNTNEMRYVDGGKTIVTKGKASTLASYCGKCMGYFGTLSAGYTYAAAYGAATCVGVGLSVIAGLGAAYCGFLANEYRRAYNKLSGYEKKTQCKLTEILFCGVTTGVTVKKL